MTHVSRDVLFLEDRYKDEKWNIDQDEKKWTYKDNLNRHGLIERKLKKHNSCARTKQPSSRDLYLKSGGHTFNKN